jgi:signal transduction histidine kinase
MCQEKGRLAVINKMVYPLAIIIVIFGAMYLLYDKLGWGSLFLPVLCPLCVIGYIFFMSMKLKYNKIHRDLDRSKGNFIALITHELKTPLTSIEGFSETLVNEEAGPLNDMQKDFVLTILKSAKKLEIKLDNIIEMTSFGPSGINLNKEAVQWEKFVNETFSEFQRSFEYQKLNTRVDIVEGIGAVRIDRKKIKKVNLQAREIQ